MLQDIKKELIKNPEKLKDVLEHFGYCNVVIKHHYIQCGRAFDTSKKAIVINLDKNDYLYVHDYPRNVQCDLFTYIMHQRNVDFIVVLNAVKKALNITDYYDFFRKKGIFGGFYESIRKKNFYKVRIYDESVLDRFTRCGNTRFLADHISLQAQHFFNIRYDVESQGIVIPIYDQFGQLMGAKERFNYDVPDGEMKYFYPISCASSQTLYGYAQNYQYLTDGTVYIFEAEKSIMQCYSYGIRNCVALGSGTISLKQIQILYELNPKKIIFCHDEGYDLENIMKNIKLVKRYSRFSEIKVGYWDYKKREYKHKVSPSDMGGDVLRYILKNEIVMIGGSTNEEEL